MRKKNLAVMILRKIKDYCHFTGKGKAQCNLYLKIRTSNFGSKEIPILHNESNYSFPLMVKGLSEKCKENHFC